MLVPAVKVEELHARLGYPEPVDYPLSSLSKPLKDWQMEEDDSAIFRYIYRNHQPDRHLEFGTWRGTGVLYCLEECNATVWTINLLQGEKNEDGTPAYSSMVESFKRRFLFFKEDTSYWYATDALGVIGEYYLKAGLGNRVCQIYCDSREWDINNYPQDFFDSALIDGGHAEDIVSNDTEKACKLVRPGGIIMWHDYCEDEGAQNAYASTRGVVSAVKNMQGWLSREMQDLFWIEPSWILLGIKK